MLKDYHEKKYRKMNIIKRFLSRIGQFLLSFMRVLRRAVCCKRKKDDFVLPMTIDQINSSTSHQKNEIYECQSHWEAWPEVTNSQTLTSALNTQEKIQCQEFHEEEITDDFFKDMVPQIRKPKKLYIRNDNEENEVCTSNRLAMDPKALLSGPDLGVIDDNPTNWDIEDSDDVWDTSELMRENKRAKREKRLAEHQRRKQEKEIRRASRQDSFNSNLNLSDSKDKAKSS